MFFFVILPGKTVKNYALVINKLEFSVQKKNKDSGIKITLKAAIKRLLFDHPANGIQAPKLGI